MSFLGASGSGGVSGRGIVPSTPTSFTFQQLAGVSNGSSPKFWIHTISSVTGSVKTGRTISANLYKASDNSFVMTQNNMSSNPYIGENLVAGTSYYAKIFTKDENGINSAESTASASLVGATAPANMGTITASNGVGILNTSWTAVNSGGATVTYSMSLYQSANSGSSYSLANTATTTNTSYAWGGLTGGSTYYYYVSITPSNVIGSSTAATSSGINVTSAAPPPPPYFAPPPSFGPWFPPPPYFCLQADSPVLIWLDGKTLQKKVKDLQIGDKVVSYTFAELPENDSEYSLNSWNSQSMTPLEVKEATVVMNEKMITQSTVFFNEDKNNRMSLEHLVFIKRSGVYSIVLAGLVEIGDTILKIDEDSLTVYEDVISSIEHINEQTEIYKLDVTPYDVFFGGNMLTHNKGPVFY